MVLLLTLIGGNNDVDRAAAWGGACPAEVQAYDWPVEEACAVSWCESRWLPWAYNAGNYGLFQVNAVHRARVRGNLDALYDPAINTAVAYELWREQGWGPWSCKPY